ncbi:MAG: nucleoside recognition domain-containing protein [Planctomycetaceae bacterium]
MSVADGFEMSVGTMSVVIGRESVGKSLLAAGLTDAAPCDANFRGSTVVVQRYAASRGVLVDTPGLLRQSDAVTTQLALSELECHESVLLVVQATQLDDDLAELLPLVAGRRGAVAVTWWDKVQPGEAATEALEKLSREAGVPFIPVDTRALSCGQRDRLWAALSPGSWFQSTRLTARAGWRIEPRPGLMERRWLGPLLAAALLVLPALLAIFGANALAEWLHPLVDHAVQPAIAQVNASWPTWARVVLTLEHEGFGYGLLNMGPFLLVWAFPTVLLFALVLGLYKSTGLLERINVAIHPWARPFGLGGRDVIRVMMGFGCNVPAVISTRACSGCSRGSAIGAIAFGAACSYQLPATLAVLHSVSVAHGISLACLPLGYLGYLLATTLIYLRLTSSREARQSLNLLLTPRRPFLQAPRWSSLWREMRDTLRQFLTQSLPVFVVICLAASVLAETGVLPTCSAVVTPVAGLFDLPATAALPVVLASIRKDGIFLLSADEASVARMSPVQSLTAVYLSSVLLPCLVTALTIARETSWRSTFGLLLRQAGCAIVFTLVLAWGGRWLL